ncbi:MAG: hypothetical protein GX318_02395 [Clostridia bacterium]|nr:hypothetical protein [Clostridia bacterium]
MKNRVFFLFNTVSIEEKLESRAYNECANPLTVAAVYEALQKTGCEIIPINVLNPRQVEEYACKYHPVDIAFNIAEGFLDIPTTLYDGTGAMKTRKLLKTLGIPSTHSCPEVMKICRNKNLTHDVLSGAGINVPIHGVIHPASHMSLISQIRDLESKLDYPMFVKPAGGGSSICIDENSIVWDRQGLVQRIELVRAVLGDYPILVETYLSGVEYTVGVMGGVADSIILPIIEFPEDIGVRSLQCKAASKEAAVEFLGVDDPGSVELIDMAARSFQELGARDIIRIDIKKDSMGRCYVIDVNGTPSLSNTASIVKMSQEAGVCLEGLISILLYKAMLREGVAPGGQLVEMVSEPSLKLRSYYEYELAI